jgi:hypothetical protein
MKLIKMLTVSACVLSLLAGSALAQDKKEEKGKDSKLPACCEKAKAAGKECTHPCCVDAKKAGKTCEKCGASKKKEEKKEEKKD